MALVRRARRVNAELARLYPDAHCELDFRTPLELAVATILSAQCTDARVNMVTPALFAQYPTAADYAAADRAEVEALIMPTGFFRNKTRSLIALGQALCERHGGEVPRTLDELVALPGIGRKTANVILGNAFGVPGLTVDTHFGRLARRLGWTQENDPVKVEMAVMRLIPKKEWTILSHRLIWHGRRVCHARTPDCAACGVARLCPSYGEVPHRPRQVAAKLVKAPAGVESIAVTDELVAGPAALRAVRRCARAVLRLLVAASRSPAATASGHRAPRRGSPGVASLPPAAAELASAEAAGRRAARRSPCRASAAGPKVRALRPAAGTRDGAQRLGRLVREPCDREMPLMADAQRKAGSDGVAVLSGCTTRRARDVRPALRRRPRGRRSRRVHDEDRRPDRARAAGVRTAA